MNTIQLIGNLVNDVRIFDQKDDQSGMATFTLAYNETFTDRQGRKVEKVSYFDAVIYGKRASVLKQYTAKGHKLAITGRLEQRRWEDAEKNMQYSVQIVVTDFDFLQPKATAPAQQEMAA